MADENDTTSTPAPIDGQNGGQADDDTPVAPVKKAAKRAPAKRAAKKTVAPADVPTDEATSDGTGETPAPAKKTAARKTAAKKAPVKKAASARAAKKTAVAEPAVETGSESGSETVSEAAPEIAAVMPLFQVPEKTTAPRKRAPRKTAKAVAPPVEPVEDEPLDAVDAVVAIDEPDAVVEPEPAVVEPAAAGDDDSDDTDDADDDSDDDTDDSDDTQGDQGPRRRRRRGGRRRRKGGGSGANDNGGGADKPAADDNATADDGSDDAAGGDAADGSDGDQAGAEGGTSRRRRRRRREGDPGDGSDDSAGQGSGSGQGSGQTTTRVRKARNPEDEITSIAGSTRLEAKKQRRRDGREAGRRRAPIVSEAEFLARRESVDRVMVVRQRDELTQIAVLEDKVLVEHYVARESQTSLIGNVYLGRVQNVLPSMEAAFIDIGKGRNAVLYAGEVNWSALGHKDGQARKIESVLSSGQTILVQVSKDPIGHKGARLTSQISLAGRFLVYVPDGTTSGISRKLPDTERNRLKTVLKEIVPDTAGVIVRTAAEGASEEELTQDVERLKARWEDIEAKASSRSGNPQLLYGEPDLTLKVVRDLFTEDFATLAVQGDDAWELVSGYVAHMAPDLAERLEKYQPAEHNGVDLFATYRIDEQIAKALDRKVFLPSGGSLVIDRTEAMTVVDVNTGKFTGSGGNLEETVTKNNLEAVEEVVRQLRLRDIGGIIVIDFIDMVLESNRDLVLRRMVECLGRDRTRHQVAEVTSLGLIQMTRKRIGTGLVEAFSETCEHCAGRGIMLHDVPVEAKHTDDDGGRRSGGNGGGNGGGAGGGNGAGNGGGNGGGASSGRRRGRGRGQQDNDDQPTTTAPSGSRTPTPAEFAAMAAAHAREEQEAVEALDVETVDTLEETVPDEVVAEPERDVEPATEAEPEPVPVPDTPPAPPAAPTVVTTTRRRGASRAVTTAGTSTAMAAHEPVTVSAPVEISVPEPPQVVTRTRGRRVPRAAATDPTDAPATDTPDA